MGSRTSAPATRSHRVAGELAAAVERPPSDGHGAPEPLVISDLQTLWVAYRAFDSAFPGWGTPDTESYLEQHDGEPFGVLRFDHVAEHRLGPPGDEGLCDHPLASIGLEPYAFYRLDAGRGVTRWIVTFHDAMLEVVALTATAFPVLFAATSKSALEQVRAAAS